MSVALGVLAGLAALVVLIVVKVATDLANKEIQGWMYDLCFIILRWSRKRLPPELRSSLYDDELLEDELRTILYYTYEKKPITALYKGLRFATGCFAGARQHARAAGWYSLRWQDFTRPERRRRLNRGLLIGGVGLTVCIPLMLPGLITSFSGEVTSIWQDLMSLVGAVGCALAIVAMWRLVLRYNPLSKPLRRPTAPPGPPRGGKHRAAD